MYKVLTINGRDYKIEYTMEAALYADCADEVMRFMAEISLSMDKTSADGIDGLMEVLRTVTNMPQKVITLFYAGLLEYHGPNGDGTVPDINTAKNLLKDYFAEHTDDGQGDFYSMMALLINQMGDDGFFKLVGLDKIFQTPEQTNSVTNVPTKTSRKKKTSANE